MCNSFCNLIVMQEANKVQEKKIIIQIFFTTHAVLKIGEYSQIFPSSRGEYLVT